MKNKGMNQYRFEDNPKEKAFAKAWENVNTSYVTGELDSHGVLDYLLAKEINQPRNEVSDRDRTVAATVIQWLGSPVGQCFLRNVMEFEE